MGSRTIGPDSDYKSGADFHFEFAAMQHVSKQVAFGVVGYHYQQVTGDSGSGAVLGDFKGRTTAIGPAANYNFQLGMLPVSTSLKWTHGLDVENRLKGASVLFTWTMPFRALVKRNETLNGKLNCRSVVRSGPRAGNGDSSWVRRGMIPL